MTCIVIAFAAHADEPGAQLHVTVANLKNTEGHIVVAVFDNKQDYLKKPVSEAVVPVRDDMTGKAAFDNLPAGRYAVAVYHDENSNGKLDTFVRIPREDYGFSNNARSPFGPPSFKSAAFDIAAGQDLHITIRSK